VHTLGFPRNLRYLIVSVSKKAAQAAPHPKRLARG
jgi:hypothetical protein